MSIQQFEHEGFNSPNEVEVARRKDAARSKSECALESSLDSINSVRSHMRALQQRLREIENRPGDRSWLLPAERIEYDSIRALFCDLRAATGSPT